MKKSDTNKSAPEKTLLLTKGVYGLETDSNKTPFRFLNGQIRTDSVINNAGWFNLAGEKIGYGDLSMQDLQTISASIPKDECFFALSEFATSWSMPPEMNASEPGKNFVLDHCIWAVSSNAIPNSTPYSSVVKVGKGTPFIGVIGGKECYLQLNGYELKGLINKLFFPKTIAKAIPATDMLIAPSDKEAQIKANLAAMQKILATSPLFIGGKAFPTPPKTTATQQPAIVQAPGIIASPQAPVAPPKTTTPYTPFGRATKAPSPTSVPQPATTPATVPLPTPKSPPAKVKRAAPIP